MDNNSFWPKEISLVSLKEYLKRKNRIIELLNELPEYNNDEKYFNRIYATVKEKIHIPDTIQLNEDGTITSTDKGTIEKTDAQPTLRYPCGMTITTPRQNFEIDLKDRKYKIESRGRDEELSNIKVKDDDGTVMPYIIEIDAKVMSLLSDYHTNDEIILENKFYR